MDPTTPSRSDLEAWEAEGLVSFEQAEAIRGPGAPWPLSRITEAVAYLGAAAFVVAVYLWYGDLAGSRWYDPNDWGAFSVLIVAAGVLGALGYALRRDTGAVGRASGALLGLGAFVGITAVEQFFTALDFAGRWPTLLAAVLGFAVAGVAWWARTSVPTELALFFGATAITMSLIQLIQDTDPYAYAAPLSASTISDTASGLIVWVLGLGWMLLGYRRILRSANTAYLLGGTTVVGGAFGLTIGVDRWWVLLAAGTAVAVLAAGTHLRRTIAMIPGAAGVLALPATVIALWMREIPEIRSWVMIYGIPGLLLLIGAVVLADRARGRPLSVTFTFTDPDGSIDDGGEGGTTEEGGV